MATIAAPAILTRIREVIEDGRGALRVTTSGAYWGGVSSVTSGEALGMISLNKPRVESRIVEVSRHPASPSPPCDMELLALALDVRVVRAFTGKHELSDAARDALQAQSSVDADVISQALEWPGNLTATEAAAATGLVSGCLRYQRSAVGTVEGAGTADGRLVTTHRFTGIARVALATS